MRNNEDGRIMPSRIKNLLLETIARHQSQAYRQIMEHGLVQFDEAVIGLADADAPYGVAELIAGKLDLPTAAAVHALMGPDEGPAAALCRVAGLQINTYSAILRMRRRNLTTPQRTPTEALTDYTHMRLAEAQQALRGLTEAAVDER